uniref:Solute carrier family 41 member 1-like n=1 Tax=Phallusia mammillata TaxID=59560 RepID=A0A6F9DSX5_9ASCI|nr:solute carrier family 41 member 1-like [Phallusia mammillata]
MNTRQRSKKLHEEAETTIKFLRRRVAKVVSDDNKDQDISNMVPRVLITDSSTDESSQEESYHIMNEERNYNTTNFSRESKHDNKAALNKSENGHYNDAFDMDYQLVESEFNQRSVQHDDISDTDTQTLLPKQSLKKAKNSDLKLCELSCNSDAAPKSERALSIALQITFPFLMAGMGMVAAGIVLDKVQHWPVFENVPEIFILVPALLGLKGNLEMTLASRLSTYANRGLLDDKKKRCSIIVGNVILVEAQAMVIAFLASLVAMVLGWIPDGKWETNDAIILCAGSLLTGAIASCLLGLVMIMVILLSRKLGINPDNVATPIAASLGDLITLTLLSYFAKGLYFSLGDKSTAWIGPATIVFFIVLTPLLLWLAHRNEYTKDVIKHGWEPVIAAMAISSTGGFILDFAVSQNKGIAVFAPVINGVGGNLVAVQASRISTYLHTSGLPLGVLPACEKPGCISPCHTFCSSDNPHSAGSRVMLSAVIPGQLIFLLTIKALEAGHTTITPQFVTVYCFVSLLQVGILLQMCQWLVIRLWKKGSDPDNSAIPYLTAMGDLLGTGLLAAGFLFLWLVGDRDADVGD